jgi:hypothetical protein
VREKFDLFFKLLSEKVLIADKNFIDKYIEPAMLQAFLIIVPLLATQTAPYFPWLIILKPGQTKLKFYKSYSYLLFLPSDLNIYAAKVYKHLPNDTYYQINYNPSADHS